MRDLGTISPSREEFLHLSGRRRVIPVTLTLLADALTPVGIYRRLAGDRPGTFLMESAAQGGVWSRYSFIGAGTSATLTTRDGQAHWQGEPPAGVPRTGDPLKVLQATLEHLSASTGGQAHPDLPTLVSGMAGFLGWETVRRWEHLPTPPPDDLHLPELALNLITDLAVHDTVDGTVTLVANAINQDGKDSGAAEAWESAVQRLQDMAARLSTPQHDPVSAAPQGWLDVDVAAHIQDSWTEEGFLGAVAKAHQAIVDGEVFQVVVLSLIHI